ncbi:MAG TPA: flagellar type III secretion system pore protein FliP [Ignavibacteria bacterium]|jgi:flagellar biosynthetic protein FliP
MIKRIFFVFLLGFFVTNYAFSQAAPTPLPLPKVTIGIDKAQKPEDVSLTLQILLIMTILSLAPALMILMTSFTRIIIVFHFLKQAMGTQQVPPSQVIVGLAIFMTFVIMAPVFKDANDNALQPYLKNQITQDSAYNRAIKPFRDFMFKQTKEEDLALFIKYSGGEKPENRENISTLTLIPAFALSELRTGFQMGFLLFIPFLMIDMIVASILMSMGMMMLPPVFVSLPFKILLFVLVDGWYLIVETLIKSFM